jgi:hypothetical protein
MRQAIETTPGRPVLLTVRGTMASPLEDTRVLHNNTAGSAPGIAAARSLGDLSHTVHVPAKTALSSLQPGELLFLDVWETAAGIMTFFADPQVKEQGGKLFSAQNATVWMPAPGAYTNHFPGRRTQSDPIVAMLRGPVASAERAIEIFAASVAKAQRDARRRGRLSHDLFVKLGEGPVEILALDVWSDVAGMNEHYREDSHMGAIRELFTAPPQPMAWEAAPGAWSEW